MKYGYARVSTVDQNPALQLAALKKAGCQKIFKDERTGEKTKRPALLRCLKAIAGRRHADCLETRPAGAQLARPREHAR